MTKQQLARRSVILSVARKLIAEKGYASVTMRELARESGVAYKTLYDLYGGKDGLLCAAIEERLCQVFGAIKAEATGSGFERLIQITERAAENVLEIPNLTRALEAVLATDPGTFSIRQIYTDVHRSALEAIKQEGDLLPWADLDFISHELMLDNSSVRLSWANGVIGDAELAPMQQYVVCKTLIPLVTGRTWDRAVAMHRRLYGLLKDSRRG